MKQPPKFNLQKPFSRFKEEVLTWNLITSVEKKLRGSLLTLSLPDEGRYGDLREKVMESVQHAGEEDENGANKENGLQLVLDFLEKHIGEDEVTDMCDKIRNFMEVKREDSQTVKEYSEMSYNIKYIDQKQLSLLSGSRFCVEFNAP